MPVFEIPPVAEYPGVTLEVPYGKLEKTNVYVKDSIYGEKDFSDYLVFWDMNVEGNRIETLNLVFAGLEEEDLSNYVKRKNTLKFFSETTFILKAKIKEVTRREDYLIDVNCIGMGVTLEDSATDRSTFTFTDEFSDEITTELCDVMTIGENEQLGKVTATWSFDNKLKALATVADFFQADWWISQDYPYDLDKFNIKLRRGSIPVIREFYDNGSNRNAGIEKTVDVDSYANDVILKGNYDLKAELIQAYDGSLAINETKTLEAETKKSNKITIRISTNRVFQSCYLEAWDGTQFIRLIDFEPKANENFSTVIDISNVNLTTRHGRPSKIRLTIIGDATYSTSSVEIEIYRMIQITSRFSAVNNIYTKVESDISEPQEGIPFDINCESASNLPETGIVRIGSDAIGYVSAYGNALIGGVSDIATGFSNAHRAGVLIFPTYDATDKANTFLSKTILETDTTIEVSDTSAFPSSGSIIISDEVISYTGKALTSFTGCSRNQNGTEGGAKPHSYLVRVFEYDSSKRYSTSSPKSDSLCNTQDLKTIIYQDTDIDDQSTAEIYASSVLEANMDPNSVDAGGLLTASLNCDSPWLELSKIHMGDSVYINSNMGIDGTFKIQKIRWVFNKEIGHRLIIEAGSPKSLFVENLISKWKVLG